MLTNELKALIGIGAVTLLILVGGVFMLNSSQSNTTGSVEQTIDKNLLVREDSPQKGSKDALVTIVEFGDYQCPACASADPIIESIFENYKDKVRIVFRHFPLPQHKNAKIAAYATEAAGNQGKYWEMHSQMYENQVEWSETNKPMDFFTKYAEKLNLDLDKWKEDLKSDEIKNKVDRDRQDGGSLSISSTPTLFINGVEIRGVPQYDELSKQIEAAMKSQGK